MANLLGCGHLDWENCRCSETETVAAHGVTEPSRVVLERLVRGVTFDDWMDEASRKSVARMWNSVKWRWWRQWPIRAMRAGWQARGAVERLARMRLKRNAPNGSLSDKGSAP